MTMKAMMMKMKMLAWFGSVSVLVVVVVLVLDARSIDDGAAEASVRKQTHFQNKDKERKKIIM